MPSLTASMSASGLAPVERALTIKTNIKQAAVWLGAHHLVPSAVVKKFLQATGFAHE